MSYRIFTDATSDLPAQFAESLHVTVLPMGFTMEEKRKLVNCCPAGLYTLQEDGSLAFDFAGCLECGTCRVVAGQTIVKEWKYPRNTKGVEFRQG